MPGSRQPFRRPRTTRRPPSRDAHVARLLFVALALVSACGPRSIPQRLRELPPDFKRVPYVQSVTPSSAVVIWQTHSPEASTLAYWTGDSTNKFTVNVDSVAIDHAVSLDELQPDTEYGYEVRTWEGRFTDARTFRTAPQPGTRKPFKFLVFGDSGEGTEGQLQLADRMPGEEAALAIHVGDVAYDNGTEVDFDFRVFAVYQDLFGSTPFYPALGNHDVRTEFGGPYLNAFWLPTGPDRTERYYSFQHDNVFFVALDSNQGVGYTEQFGNLRDADGAQARWLDAELARARADPTVDWVVVYFHHAIFSAGRGVGGHGPDLALQSVLVPIFDRHRVDLVLMGHDHHYERTWPLRCGGNAVTPACRVETEDPQVVPSGSGTVYVVTGAGGGPFAWRAVGVDWWTAFARQVFQYVTVEVSPEGLLMEGIDVGGQVVDQVRIASGEETPAEAPPAGETPDEATPGDTAPVVPAPPDEAPPAPAPPEGAAPTPPAEEAPTPAGAPPGRP